MSNNQQADGSGSHELTTVKVWDPVVRIGHWVIVIGVLTAYFTGDEVPNVHIWAGYIVGITVIVRVIWGFVGTRHARFSSFVKGPGSVWRYVSGLLKGEAKRSIGHNAAGGAMTVALLIALSGVMVSGLALQAIEDGTGPLAGIMASSGPPVPELGEASQDHQTRAYEDYDDEHEEHDDRYEAGEAGDEGAEELYESLHSIFVYITLALAGIHVIGVLVSSLVHRENLPASMITGRKRP